MHSLCATYKTTYEGRIMNENIIIGIFIITAIFLATQRWFWTMLFGVGALASFLSIFASVISFQILPAIGFIFLYISNIYPSRNNVGCNWR